MARPPEFPLVIRQGSVAVKIYRVVHRQAADGFVYSVAWSTGGKRHLQQFTKLDKAQEEARLKANQLASGEATMTEMTRADRELLLNAKRIAGDTPLLAALEEWKKAREIAAAPLIPVAEAWAARNSTKFTPLTAELAVERFIAAKQNAGQQGERTYRSKLTPFVESFGNRTLHSISAAEFAAYLEQFEHAVTRNDHLKRARTLLRWAQRFGHLPRHVALEIDGVDRAKEPRTKIGIISPDTFARLLQYFSAHYPELLAAVALAGFTGIRSDELHGKRGDGRKLRQMWEDVHLERGFLQVTNAKENTPASRTVPLCPACVEWLLSCPGDREGPVCAPGAMEVVRRVAIEAGFELPENCFRHSYISYRIAATGNKDMVATEAGNSVKEIDSRYRTPLHTDVGEQWFNLTRANCAKVGRKS